MTEDIKKIYQEAIDKWGFNPQLNQLQEEFSELFVACNISLNSLMNFYRDLTEATRGVERTEGPKKSEKKENSGI
jgi:hypothetical protein